MTNFVSAGRNLNQENCCDGKLRCIFLEKARDRDGGWCTNPVNRVAASVGWPNGFIPSVASTGGCSLHLPAIPQPNPSLQPTGVPARELGQLGC